MKKSINILAVVMMTFLSFKSFSQAPNGGPVTVSQCEADCPFGSCKIECKTQAGSSGGGAICACPYGFATCACGGGGGGKAINANPHQLDNVNSLINHLGAFVSPAGINLRSKVIYYRDVLSLNSENNLSTTTQEIIGLIEGLNLNERTSYLNFLQTLLP